MKNSILITAAIILCSTAVVLGQDQVKIKKIEVNGVAEKEVIPDEIYFRIALREYKDGSRKVTLDKLESELVSAVKKLNLPKESLQVENIYGYNWDHRKKQPDEFLATKSFLIKLGNLKQINDLMANLDPEGINSSAVDSYSHTKLEDFKKDLRIEALKKAKEKATYLLAAIDEELGKVLEIQEIDYGNNQPMYARSFEAKMVSSDQGYQSDLEFKTIKIKAEIRAVFEIK